MNYSFNEGLMEGLWPNEEVASRFIRLHGALSESWGGDDKSISELRGLTLRAIISKNDYILFITECGRQFHMFHQQDCCEDVVLDDVCGDFADLIGSPIITAEESTSESDPSRPAYDAESETWTFYRIETAEGGVSLRWFGQSNGYYSESVDFCELYNH